MMLVSRAGLVFIFKLLLLISCINKSDKAKVEKQNSERFSSRTDRKEAQFLVDAVDKSYGLLEVAELGLERLEHPESKAQVEDIIERQTTVAIRLKTYAEANDVSIPFSGPEKTKQRVQNLYNKTGSDFKTSWLIQLDKLNDNLKNELEDFREKASEPLRDLLDSTLMLIQENERMIASFESAID